MGNLYKRAGLEGNKQDSTGKVPSGNLYQRAGLEPRDTPAPSETVDPSKEMSRAEAFGVGLGRGFVRASRGARMLWGTLTGDDETINQLRLESQMEKKYMEPLKQRYPLTTGAGEISGEIAATLPLGLGVGSIASKGATRLGLSQGAARIGGAVSGGASEGAVIGAEQDQALTGAILSGVTAGVFEKLSPIAWRYAKKYIGRKPITAEELTQAMQSKGASAQEISEALNDMSGLSNLPTAQTPQSQAILDAYEGEGITPAMRSRITRSVDDASKEVQLLRQVDSDEATALRQRLFDEEQAIQDRAARVAEEMGESKEAGASIQRALKDVESQYRGRRNQAYNILKEQIEKNPEVSDMVPLPKSRIKDSILNSQSTFLKANPSEANALDELMAEYGLIGDKVVKGPRKTTVQFLDNDGNVVDSITFRGIQKKLNIGSSEEFRKGLNNIFDMKDSRQAAASKSIVGDFDRSLDEMVEGIGESNSPKNIVNLAKNARSIARDEKVVFDPKRIVSKISKGNSDGSNLMEASKVYDEIRRATPENTKRLIETISKVDSGRPALNNLRAATLVDLMEQATKTARVVTDPSTPGVQLNQFSGTNFKKAINKFGREKMNTIFSPEQIKIIKNLETIGDSKITPELSVQKGSAPDLLNKLINSFARIGERVPGGPLVSGAIRKAGDVAEGVAQRGRAAQTLREVTDFSPSPTQIEDFIFFSAPRLSIGLGLGTTASSIATEKN